MATYSKVLIQGGKTPGLRMEVTVPTSHTYACETAKAQYNFEGAQYIWQKSWDDDDNNDRNYSPSYGSSSSLGESAGTLAVLAGIVGIIAFWEVIVTVLIVGAIGGGSFLGLGMFLNWKEEQDKIKKKEEAEKNRPAQVSHKYRVESFK